MNTILPKRHGRGSQAHKPQGCFPRLRWEGSSLLRNLPSAHVGKAPARALPLYKRRAQSSTLNGAFSAVHTERHAQRRELTTDTALCEGASPSTEPCHVPLQQRLVASAAPCSCLRSLPTFHKGALLKALPSPARALLAGIPPARLVCITSLGPASPAQVRRGHGAPSDDQASG